jgi:ABC-type lipoprotein release transport system permease subunit
MDVAKDALRLATRGLAYGTLGSVFAVYVVVPAFYFNVRLLNWPLVALIVVSMAVLTIAASIAPMIRVGHLNPADVMRN